MPRRLLNLLKTKQRPAGEMTFTGHLAELRKRVIISLVAVAAASVVGFTLWDWVLKVATEPYCDAQRGREVSTALGDGCQLYITEPLQLLTTRLSVSGYLGLLFASPIVLWQLWRFITPGLNKNEKRYAIPFVISSVFLFGIGAFAAWLTFPKAIEFFITVGGQNVETLFNPAPYLKLIFLMMIISGAVFELPVILVALQLVGILKSSQLRSWRRYAICINFVAAAIATPSQDPYSLLAMALPMCIFYELAILIGRLIKR